MDMFPRSCLQPPGVLHGRLCRLMQQGKEGKLLLCGRGSMSMSMSGQSSPHPPIALLLASWPLLHGAAWNIASTSTSTFTSPSPSTLSNSMPVSGMLHSGNDNDRDRDRGQGRSEMLLRQCWLRYGLSTGRMEEGLSWAVRTELAFLTELCGMVLMHSSTTSASATATATSNVATISNGKGVQEREKEKGKEKKGDKLPRMQRMTCVVRGEGCPGTGEGLEDREGWKRALSAAHQAARVHEDKLSMGFFLPSELQRATRTSIQLKLHYLSLCNQGKCPALLSMLDVLLLHLHLRVVVHVREKNLLFCLLQCLEERRKGRRKGGSEATDPEDTTLPIPAPLLIGWSVGKQGVGACSPHQRGQHLLAWQQGQHAWAIVNINPSLELEGCSLSTADISLFVDPFLMRQAEAAMQQRCRKDDCYSLYLQVEEEHEKDKEQAVDWCNPPGLLRRFNLDLIHAPPEVVKEVLLERVYGSQNLTSSSLMAFLQGIPPLQHAIPWPSAEKLDRNATAADTITVSADGKKAKGKGKGKNSKVRRSRPIAFEDDDDFNDIKWRRRTND
jgi:hypothetical protein